ncbi:hypothetical protein [Halioxenophilus aromaticivorans]|uniref:Uncharacterized protein n=1 Tax=Halioxenophilus aromaticivorans TaxID=1306992 RepID=A0AAV3TXT6_9ALTE
MSKINVKKLAEEFLASQDIGFVPPGIIGRKEERKIEVMFPAPETLDPKVAVVEPPDFRVWVNAESGVVELELVHQM